MTQVHTSEKPRLMRRVGGDERSPWRHYVLLAGLVGILGLLMVYPVLRMIAVAFTPPQSVGQGSGDYFYWFRSVLAPSPEHWLNPFTQKVINSLLLAAVVTVLCNLIAFPLALISHRYSFRGKALLSALVLVPMVLPPFVGAIGMRQLLAKFGSLTIMLQHMGILGPSEGINWLQLGGFWALAVLITLGLYPIAYLNLQAALANIDPAMLEAAQNLGGRRVRNFFKITLPLAMPGIFAGSTIIFIWAFTELGTPLLIDYRNVVSRAIWDDLSAAQSGTSPISAAKTSIVLTISVLAYLVGKFIFGRKTYAMSSKAAVAATTETLGFRGSMLAALPFLGVTLLAMLPHIGVVLYSVTAIAVEPAVGWGPEGHFGWYRTVIPSRYTLAGYANVFNNPYIYGSILNSIQYAAISTTVDLVLGIATAWVLVRTKVFGRTLLDVLAMLPLAIPGLVMAMGYLACRDQVIWAYNGIVGGVYHLFGQNDFPRMDAFFFNYHPLMILVIAYSMRRMPYLVRSATAGLQQTSVSLEEAAANMGASPMRVIMKITLPLIMANLIAGAMLTFSFAMLEVSDSLMLAPMPESYPITKMIYSLGTDTAGADNVRNACALGVLAMGLLIVTIVTAGTLMGKRLGAIFRA